MHFCSDAILFRRGHYSEDAMRPQHSHCGPLSGQVEFVDEKRWPWRAAVRLGNGQQQQLNLMKANCRIYYRRIAAG